MSHVFQSRVTRARKRHRCTWCDEWIEKGEYYERYAYKDDVISSCCMHGECYVTMQEDAHEWGAPFDFVPGSYCRGFPVKHVEWVKTREVLRHVCAAR